MKKYMTVFDLMDEAARRAKRDKHWPSGIEEIVNYMHVFSLDRDTQITRCDFNVVCQVFYGRSDGIYATLSTVGVYNDTPSPEKRRPLALYMIKTMNTDIDSYMSLAQAGNLIAYHAGQVIQEKLGR